MGIIERFSLDGRTALVTGAGQGIGRGYALALAEAGADVAIVDINPETAERSAGEVRQRGRRSLAIVADVSLQDDVTRPVDSVVREWGGLDIGVNNAGGGGMVDAVDYTESSWDAAIALNLKSVFLCTQAEARVMLPRKRGKIINTASISGGNRQPRHDARSLQHRQGRDRSSNAKPRGGVGFRGHPGQRHQPGQHPDAGGSPA